MCGIVGVLDRRSDPLVLRCTIKEMMRQLAHRGPDSDGCWHDDSLGIGLGHRRLSILDPSDAGHQPMISPSGRYVVTFNGEIYNHQKLRAEMPFFKWRSKSDTETLLVAFETWGIVKAVKKLAGMYAFAVWDSQNREVVLCRDRFGEKPLYYGEATSGPCFFASEVGAFSAMPFFSKEISTQSVAWYQAFGVMPSESAIYEGVKKVPPGAYVILSNDGNFSPPISYWSALEASSTALQDPFTGSYSEAKESVKNLLRKSVEQQMISDVPLGAFLSGGIDSSVIAAMMQSLGGDRVKTFSVGFSQSEMDESHHASRVAEALGTDHRTLTVEPADVLNVIPDYAASMGEPLADASYIATRLLSRFARQHVSVSLSGDGGDELFAGYNRHRFVYQYWALLSWLPLKARRNLGSTLAKIPVKIIEQMAGFFGADYSQESLRLKLSKLNLVLGAQSPAGLYSAFISASYGGRPVMSLLNQPSCAFEDFSSKIYEGASLLESCLILDTAAYLPENVLTKVDRAAMAESLEVRAPILDHQLYEFVSRLPVSHKIGIVGRGLETKRVLKDILGDYLPRELFIRPKMGFSVPLGPWLRGPLREWAQDLLTPDALKQSGYFNAESIRALWHRHLNCEQDNHIELWNTLMLQAWLIGQRGAK